MPDKIMRIVTTVSSQHHRTIDMMLRKRFGDTLDPTAYRIFHHSPENGLSSTLVSQQTGRAIFSVSTRVEGTEQGAEFRIVTTCKNEEGQGLQLT